MPMNTNMPNMNMMNMMNPNMMNMMNQNMMNPNMMNMNPNTMNMNPNMMMNMKPNMMNQNMMNMMMPMNMNNQGNQTNSTMRRLTKEFQLCSQDSELIQIGCNFGLIDKADLFKWQVTMVGPKNTPYEGGLFTIHIIFPKDYPKMGPEFRFVNKILHLNVDFRDKNEKGLPGNGHICLNTLNEWKTTGQVKGKRGYAVKQALFDIYYLFFEQGTTSPYDAKYADLYKNHRDKFDEEARSWTKKYASVI